MTAAAAAVCQRLRTPTHRSFVTPRHRAMLTGRWVYDVPAPTLHQQTSHSSRPPADIAHCLARPPATQRTKETIDGNAMACGSYGWKGFSSISMGCLFSLMTTEVIGRGKALEVKIYIIPAGGQFPCEEKKKNEEVNYRPISVQYYMMLIHQSRKRSVLNKQELIDKIIESNPKIVDKGEIEEQLRLLQEFVPEWISKKNALSGDILCCVDTALSQSEIRQRLHGAV